MRRIQVGLPLAALVVVLSTTAWAQGSASIRQARRHMDEGQELFLQERWEQAAQAFLQAYSFRPHSAFLFNAALAWQRHGDNGRAAELYQRYLTDSPNASDAEAVRQRIQELGGEPPTPATAATDGSSCTPPDCPTESPPDCASAPEGCPDSSAEGGPPGIRIVRQTPGQPDSDSAAVRIVRTDRRSTAGLPQMKSIVFVGAEPTDAAIALVNEEGLEVTRGESPLEVAAEAGRYTLRLEHPEYRATSTPVVVASGRYYVFHIEMSQPPAFLQVSSNVPNSTIYLDDRSAGAVGTTPWGDVVRTGTHRIWVERPGYRTVEETIEIGLGQEREVQVELERLDFGVVRVLANVDENRVLIGGEPVGTAPLDHQLAPGTHHIEVQAPRMKDYHTEVTVERGQTTRVLVRLNPRPSRTSAWVSMSFSLLTFAAAAVVGGLSYQTFNELEEEARQGRLATDDERIDRGQVMAIAADVGFAVGAVIAGLTLYYFLRDPLPPSEGRTEDPVDFEVNPEPQQEVSPSTAREEREEAAAVGRFDGRRPWPGLSFPSGRDTVRAVAQVPRLQFRWPGLAFHY
jgi:hypothetical protein